MSVGGVVLGVIVGTPIVVLIILAGVCFSALEAYVVWLGWTWHLVPAGMPVLAFSTIWAADIIFSLMTTHLIYRGKIDNGLAIFLGRPITALIAWAMLAWLR
jgi:hypothetical protein